MSTNLLQGLSSLTTSSQPITTDILVLRFTIVNAFLVGQSQAATGTWVLVDTGLENSADFILESAEARFGKASRPAAIILTHGHFDHVGSVSQLANHWDVPVYAHEMEMPYLTGKKDYPPADPTVDPGLVARMSPTFPRHSIDLGKRVHPLPADGSVPGMLEWRWVHTPGHTPGHICLFRDSDRVLLAADAFTTVKQESFTAVLTQEIDVNGPPAYFTTDWEAAEKSVQRLAQLNPSLVLPSHGQPLKDEELHKHLQTLANHFEEIAVPKHGRYVD